MATTLDAGLLPDVHSAHLHRLFDILHKEADFKHELMAEWHAFPSLRWRQFLAMKLSEAKRARHRDFTTICFLQNLLARA